ncbi:MAG: hypothetical protein ABJM11_19740 [Marinobacter sp.]|uniref:hypothetical protein n=1 Tax=Marinobacter sp. TaxID=50741 RepID=UPI003298A419
MKKLHSLAFYALITPAIALGSAALLAEESGNKDVGEQDMDQHGGQNQNSEEHEGSTKSKYNADDSTDTTDAKADDQSGKPKKEDRKSSSDEDMTE